MIDLKRIDEAEEAIKQSLVLDPESKAGRNELKYVIQLRRESKEECSQLGKAETDKHYGELLMKLSESGDLPGLDMEPDEATGQFVGGMAVRLSRGSKQVAMALIGTERVILAGDEVAEKLAAKIGVGFIHARDLAKRVVAGIPPRGPSNAYCSAPSLRSGLAESSSRRPSPQDPDRLAELHGRHELRAERLEMTRYCGEASAPSALEFH